MKELTRLMALLCCEVEPSPQRKQCDFRAPPTAEVTFLVEVCNSLTRKTDSHYSAGESFTLDKEPVMLI